MAFAVHTFETNPSKENLGFSFHETLGEGQEIYFLGKFSENTIDPKMVSESLFGAIVESFASSDITDPYDRFEDSLKAVNLEAKKLKANLPSTPEIVVAFFDFHNLYLSQSNESEAYLVRGTNLSQITETSADNTVLFANILSGQVAIDDIVLLSTSRILRVLTTNQIIDLLGRSDFDEAISLLRHELSQSSEDDILVTAIGIGKKDATSSSGFLSKVVEKGKKITESKKTIKVQEEPLEEIEEEELETDDFEDESFVEEKPPLKVKDLLGKFQFLKNIKGFKGFKPKKNAVIIAGTVLVILVLVIGIKSIANFESANTKELREKLSIARESLIQADTFLLQGERSSAADFLKKAQESVQIVLSSKSKSFRSDAQFLLADIQEKQLQVENAKKVTPQLLADLGVKNDNLEAVGLLELNGSLFVHDLKQVYKTVRNIVEKGLPVSDKETILASTTRTDQNSILFLTDAPRIVEYREGLITPMNTEDEIWKRGLDIKTYGRYAYVLDPVENQIWKYERRRAKYSPAVAYNQGADLSRGISMTIDGSIFILSDDGTIQRIFRGVKTEYSFRDLPSIPFSGKNLKLYTTTNLDFLYLLDPDNSRILVFVKGERFATYKKQVIFDLPGTRDFVIDDSGQKVNVLTKDKIYEFSL
ncbi:hypothetical protein K9M41_00695 [Candidatus Gracilibacteria bacterium]|nr:hypothetical protein [Candidatus Gracilibacteria bacterium]